MHQFHSTQMIPVEVVWNQIKYLLPKNNSNNYHEQVLYNWMTKIYKKKLSKKDKNLFDTVINMAYKEPINYLKKNLSDLF